MGIKAIFLHITMTIIPMAIITFKIITKIITRIIRWI